MDRDHDLVLFGATGFVGRLCAEYLAEHAPADLRIAIAGRSHQRLEALRSRLPEQARQWSLLVADSNDEQDMLALASSTRVVATTVGPYRKYGMTLAAACAKAGTDYLDLTGELLFVHDSITRNHTNAIGSGARIVHACGFDSIPSDLGVLESFRAAQQHGLGSLTDTTLVVTSMRGGFSGGTIDSMRTQVDEIRDDGSLLRVLGDPYALSPERAAEPQHRRSPAIANEPALGGWTGPFVMAPFNTRIVRRSNALTGWSYGHEFRYREVSLCGPGPRGITRAGSMAFALGSMVKAMSLRPARLILDRVLPSPGEGPKDDAMTNGRFRMRIHANTTSGGSVVTKVGLDLDPGYRGTALMFMEAALCLAGDVDRRLSEGGVLTPATAMGSALIDRLRSAGMTIEAAPA
jgi:short subunit dehydrogenase-like uncharacterized protein